MTSVTYIDPCCFDSEPTGVYLRMGAWVASYPGPSHFLSWWEGPGYEASAWAKHTCTYIVIYIVLPGLFQNMKYVYGVV